MHTQIPQASMDQELSATKMGKSFIVNGSSRTGGTAEEPQEGNGTAGEAEGAGGAGGAGEDGEDGGALKPVDLDVNLVTHLLSSMSSQGGFAGPASNLLQQMGIVLPANDD